MADARAPAAQPGRRLRLLVVDDSDDIRLLLRFLTAQRVDVECVADAENGEDAIVLVGALRPDLLVLDVEMPVLDGISALPRLREVAPDTRVVMLSNLAEPVYEQRARAAGAVAYVHKSTPVTSLIDELLRAADLLDTVIDTLAGTHRGVAGDVLSPRRARRFLADTLDAWGEAHVVDTVTLLVSELVANVVVHTSTTPEVSVRLLSDRVHVEVRDGDPTLPTKRDASDAATSGRGIAMVDALALAWGAVPIEGGKVVWFDVARESARDTHPTA